MQGVTPPATEEPDVSVIVATYNGAAYVECALDSLVRHAPGHYWRLRTLSAA